MSSYYWAKVWIEVLDDPKMGQLSDRLWRRTIELVLMAKELDKDGILPKLKDMAWRLRTTPDILETELFELVKVGVVETREEGWFLVNFEKRQGAMTDAERKARQREREKSETYHGAVTNVSRDGHESSHVTVTNCDTETDKDTDKEKETRACGVDDLIAHFRNSTGFEPPAAGAGSIYVNKWLNPCRDFLELAAGDIQAAKAIMTAAIDYMRRERLTIATPKSLVTVAKNQAGQGQRPHVETAFADVWRLVASKGRHAKPDFDTATMTAIRRAGGYYNLCTMTKEQAEQVFRECYQEAMA